jgi:outer membrane protein assembly factor BamB
MAARPVVDGELVYAGGGDGVLTAYERGDGRRRWRAWTGGKIVTSPVVAQGVVVVASGDGKLNGVSTEGAPLWKAEAGQVSEAPVVAGDSVCVVVESGTVRCVLLKDGAELDGIADEVAITRISGGDGVVYAAGKDGSISAWDAHTGTLRWRQRPGTNAAGFPVTRAGEVDVTYPDGRIVGLDAASGALLWQNVTGDRFDVAGSGDEAGLFVVGHGGTLYALRPPGSKGAPAVTSAPTTATPTIEPTSEPTSRAPTRRRTTRPTATYTTKPSPTATKTTEPTPTTEPTTDPAPTETTPAAKAPSVPAVEKAPVAASEPPG